MESGEYTIKLLLVDDELEFLAATARALSRRGFQVTQAPSGSTALETLRKGSVDVVVLDMKMPGIDGEELFGIIRRRWPHLPVIMLTGHGTVQQAFRTSKDGIYDYLAKPCEIDLLAQVARDAATGRRNGVDGEPEEDPEEEGVDHRKIRLLLVDDEEELLGSLSRVLMRRGMSVETAANGAQALEVLRKKPFDIAVLDMKMPGMDGLELLQQIQSTFPRVQVIILTGHPTLSSMLSGIKQGAFDYLLKPVDPNALVERIRKAYLTRNQDLEADRERQIQEILKERPD